MKKSLDFNTLLTGLLEGEKLLAGSLSKLRKTSDVSYQKVSVRPVQLKRGLHYQITYHYPDKEIHENHGIEETQFVILDLMQTTFRQGHFFTVQADWQVLVSKKGAIKILQHPPSRNTEAVYEHDVAKQYLLKEGTAYPFLVALGVMNRQGKVLAKRYHKFRQLNKYLEIVRDCLPILKHSKSDRPLTIVDFGSGKAYLTFALYHYLVEQLDLDVKIIGLDLKADVVSFCNQMATKLGYDNLRFFHEDIKDFEASGHVDMVVSLHACDVATDYALAQAVRWQAKVILAVPCCQHELFGQLDKKTQPILFEHGILKERVSALLTDAARAKLLEVKGYTVRVMEFIDLEHTPKNLLIRALREPQQRGHRITKDYKEFQEFWGIKPTLANLLGVDR